MCNICNTLGKLKDKSTNNLQCEKRVLPASSDSTLQPSSHIAPNRLNHLMTYVFPCVSYVHAAYELCTRATEARSMGEKPCLMCKGALRLATNTQLGLGAWCRAGWALYGATRHTPSPRPSIKPGPKEWWKNGEPRAMPDAMQQKC